MPHRSRFVGPDPCDTSLKLTLTEAAIRQVDAAIDALERGDFDIAVTLAGAAEGMIQRDGVHAFALVRDRFRPVNERKKDWISALNQERDWLKHGGFDEMEIESFTAAMMIVRATSKLEKKDWTEKMEEFQVWIKEHIDDF